MRGAGMTGHGLRCCLAVGLLGLVGGVALVGPDARRPLAGRNHARLERLLDRVTGSATPFGTALVAVLVYYTKER